MPTPTPDSAAPSAPSIRHGYVWGIAFVAALGGLLFGYDWVVIGGAKPFFEPHFGIVDAARSGWANSCALVGCFFGALATGALSERCGRKRLLLAAALLFTVTSLGNALAPTFALFVAWRILGGVAIGFASNLSPLYIAEVAPAAMRGRLVSVNQLTIVIGILAAQLVNWALVRHLPAGATAAFIRQSWYGTTAWRWMFGLTAVPALGFFLGMFAVPESPRWLAKRARTAEAEAVLRRIGGAGHARAELDAIGRTLAAESSSAPLRALLDRRIRRVLLLGVGLAVFQQWCGINVIFNYAEDIFRAAGYSISGVLQNIAWTGSVNLVMTLASLGVVDRAGRRPLLLGGAAALAVIYAAIGACYHAGVLGWPVLVLVLAAIAAYATSLAPVTWVVISEIFPNRVRGAAMAVAVAALWLACFVLTDTFPLLNAGLGPAGTFWLYAAICAAAVVLLARTLPETKRKSLEEIEAELTGR
jgi:MFS transporter, SP family, xylose:H+ symportor